MMGIIIDDDEKKINRKSLHLQHKINFVNFEKLIYLTICYSSLRVVPMISEYSFKVLGKAGMLVGRSALGAAFLETIYRGQEHVIQSAPWYDSSGGLIGSAALAASNIGVAAVVLKFFPFCGLPWFMMKFRDSFADSFRFI
jgi:hypothetical protein